MQISELTKSLVQREGKRGQAIVMPNNIKAVEYVAYCSGEFSSDPEQAMQVAIQHTQVWGVAQAIAQLEAEFNSRIDDGLKKGKYNPAKVQVIKYLFLAKLLHDVFVVDTNFTDKYKDVA